MGKRDSRVDEYINAAAPFARPILRRIRSRFHKASSKMTESIKWGCPYFEKDGMVGGMAAFKAHVSIGFWNGDRLSDPRGLLAGAGGSEMAAMKVASLDELPDDAVLVGFIKEAVALNESGFKRPKDTKRRDPSSVKAPADLLAALEKKPKARKTFENFAYSHRKEYVTWIEEAKRPETRAKRVAQAVEWMTEGKRRNWKYEDC